MINLPKIPLWIIALILAGLWWLTGIVATILGAVLLLAPHFAHPRPEPDDQDDDDPWPPWTGGGFIGSSDPTIY